MLISLVRSKKVCNFADSLYVPVFDPLRLVEVIVILLDDLALCGFIFTAAARRAAVVIMSRSLSVYL